MGGIKLQLLCGVRIELAVGSLPYPDESGFPIVSPGRDRPLSGFPICKPCLDMRQNPSRDTHFPSYGRRPLPKPKPKTYMIFKVANEKSNCWLFIWKSCNRFFHCDIIRVIEFLKQLAGGGIQTKEPTVEN